MIFDTIAAIATPPGEGGIGIIRVSGPESWQIVSKFFNFAAGKSVQHITSHMLYYGYFINEKKEIIDECLLAFMKRPKTFTCEDVVEINCHGGSLPLLQIMKVLLANGIRLAEAGEFTKRAFLNGRIDLTQAESIIDIIRAKTNIGLKFAVKQLKGNLSNKIINIRSSLIHLLAAFEANIDFPEEDVPLVDYQEVENKIEFAIREINQLIASWDEGKIFRDGLKTVIIGKPNVGKSSLLNVLVKEERAIVTDIPGTTRDVIEEIINLKGIPLKIIDTAGIRETVDLVEKLGVEKSWQLLAEADLILFVVDATQILSSEDQLILSKINDKNVIVLLNKIDLSINHDTVEKIEKSSGDKLVIKISTKKALGIDELINAIKDLVFAGKAHVDKQTAVTNGRHYAALVRAVEHLHNIKTGIENNLPVDFLSIDLTSAYDILGEIIGETAGEDVIDQIFADFCIGK